MAYFKVWENSVVTRRSWLLKSRIEGLNFSGLHMAGGAPKNG